MISKAVRALVEKKFGHSVKYSRDCEALAGSISSACRCKISATTIRRLFGITKCEQTPREYTLDLLAQYVGFKDYDDLLASLNTEVNDAEVISEVIVDDLKKGEKFEIGYSPNRKLTVHYLGRKQFKVLNSINSSLQKEDVIKLSYFSLHLPIFILEIERGGLFLGKLIEAKVSGVISIKKLT